MIDTGTPEPIRGRQAIRARAVDLLAAFGDFRLGLVDRDVNFWDVPGLMAQLSS